MIDFTYSINSVDEALGIMEVTYSAEGERDVTVSARVPYEDELIADVIKEYAPFGVWRDDKTPKAPPQAGATGAITYVEETQNEEIVEEEPLTFAEAKEQAIERIAVWRKQKLDIGVLVDGKLFGCNHRDHNNLIGIGRNIQNGVYTKVNYRLLDDTFTIIDGSNIDSIISAVALHIESVFTEEKEKINTVNTISDQVILEAYDPRIIQIPDGTIQGATL